MLEMEIKQNLCIAKIRDHFTLDDVYEIIEQAEASAVKGVILEIEEIEILSSVILGMLSSIYVNLKEIQIQFGLTGLDHDNKDLLLISGLDKVFSVFDNLSEGIKVFSEIE